MISHIIFDIDGVLTVEDAVVAKRKQALFASLMEKKNISASKAETVLIDAKKSLPADKANTTVNVYEAAGLTREECFAAMNNIDQSGVTVGQPGVFDVISALSKEVMLCAYSNTPKRASKDTLQRLSLLEYFTYVFTADDFEESKPSVKNMQRICHTLQASSSCVLMIGNNYDKDLVPAEKIGMHTLLFGSDGISTMDELFEAVKEKYLKRD